MKGYFSQLARSSGLSFGPAGGIAGRVAAAAKPPLPEGVTTINGVAPLHVNEVIVAPPSVLAVVDAAEANRGESVLPRVLPRLPSLASSASESPASPSARSALLEEVKTQESEPIYAEDQPLPTAESIPPSRQIILEDSPVQFIESVSAMASPKDNVVREPFAGPDQPQAFSGGRSLSTPHSAPATIVEKFEMSRSDLSPRESARLELPAPTRSVAEPENPVNEHLPAAVERSDLAPDTPLETQLLVRNYLKEVRAWVATPTETVEDSSEPETGFGERTDSSDMFDFEPASHTVRFAPAVQAEAPAVQDLSLSIGSISIVIEEPQKNMPAPIVTQPRAESSTPRGDREPTNLSRYYLRTW